MPTRRHFLVTRHFYHLYNQTLAGIKPFLLRRYSSRFVDIFYYYNQRLIPISYSQSLNLRSDNRPDDQKKINRPKVEILAFCLMPNHFHFLVKQVVEQGISSWIRDVLNSFTKYYNNSQERKGPVFLPRFKSRPIISEEHLIHVSRYIHLNPFAAGLTTRIEEIASYPYSSLREYLKEKADLTKRVEQKYILLSDYFAGNRRRYFNFLTSEAQHSRTNHLTKYCLNWGS